MISPSVTFAETIRLKTEKETAETEQASRQYAPMENNVIRFPIERRKHGTAFIDAS